MAPQLIIMLLANSSKGCVRCAQVRPVPCSRPFHRRSLNIMTVESDWLHPLVPQPNGWYGLS